jgi:hypothetical protein
MRTFLAAMTATAILALPIGAMAQQNPQQQTPAQQNLKDGVKAEPRTPKRDQIIRSEESQPVPGHTTGTAPATPR